PTFQGTSGQRISVNYTNVAMSNASFYYLHTWLVKPDGPLQVPSREFGNGGTFVDTTVLPSSGSYSIVVDPEAARTGTLTITAYDVPADVGGTLTPVSAAASALTTLSLHDALPISPTFQGTSGQRISVNYTNVAM